MRKSIFLLIFVLCLAINTGCESSNKNEVIHQTTSNPNNTDNINSVAESPNNITTEPTNTPAVAAQASKGKSGFYINSKYGFSINYPTEWMPSDESPAGDGVVLYEKDGNDIRVYGGYIIDDFIDKQIKEYESTGLEVSYLITDNGEKGTLIEGNNQGKILLHFIVLGKEIQCQFYALVTPEYYEKNKAILLKAAKQLFLDEKPDLSEFNEIDSLTVYQKYLSNLPPQHIKNISLAENAYKSLITNDKSRNDKLFRLFREFYNSVNGETDNYFTDGGKEVTDDVLTPYGFRINWSESGDFITEDPGYFYSHFSSSLSDGLKEFLLTRKKHFEQYPATYLVEDAALSTTWDSLSDWVIDWEKYINKYPDYEEAKEAESDLDFFLDIYLLDFSLDNTPMFENDVLTKELRDSYSRFQKLYPDSKYYSIIKGYYDILKQNNFRLSKEATDFLADHGIKYASADPFAEDASFIPNFEGIKEIMNLKKDEVIEKLGSDYKIVEAGAEGQEEGYYYEKYGMTIVFDDVLSTDMIDFIDCYEEVDIKGIRVGMSFEDIRKVLGGGETRDLVQIEPNQPNYALFYEIENFIVWFGATEKDGATTDLQIRRKY